MPELPEVETIRRQLEPRLRSRVVDQLEILDPLWCSPEPASLIEHELSGRRIEQVGRRGKYLVLEFEDERFLIMHLRMTGNLLWSKHKLDDEPSKHLRVRFDLDDGLVGFHFEEQLALLDRLAFLFLPGHELASLLSHLESGHHDADCHK